MATEPRRWRRLAGSMAVFLVVGATVGAVRVGTAGAAGPAPIAVTPYSGFNSLLTRAPYVTDLGQTSADVTWATSESAAGSLEWGPQGNCTLHRVAVPSSLPTLVPASGSPASATGRQFTVNSISEYQSTVPLTGLSASTTYCYRPLSSTGTDLLGSNSSPTFTTLDAVGASQPLTFDVVGDLGETLQSASVPFPNNLNPDQAAIDSLIGSSGARFDVTAGDIAYSGGSETNYGDLEQTGSEISDVFGPSYWPETRGVPTFGVVGNHGQNVDSLRVWPESTTAQASSGTYAFDSYPALPADGTSAKSSPDAWYAFSTGNVRIYVLDAAWADSNVGTSNLYQVDHDEHWTTSSPEYKWLAADLAAHPGGVKMAVFHFPMRSDNSTQSSDTLLQNTSSNPNSLESLLSAGGVKVVFNGHAHTYQRIAPSASGDVVNYVTGGGGGILEPVSGGSSCSAFTSSGSIYALGWSPTSGTGTACGGAPTPQSAAQVFNFLKVTVSGNTVTVSPTNAAGQVFDQQSYTYPGSSFPATIIDSAPSGLTSSTTATITFHSSPPGATFTCGLDGAAATPCTSPVTYSGLAQGSHTFSVVGTNSSGTNPIPTTASWTVDTSKPSTPGNVMANAASAHEVDLSWSQSSDNTGVTGYDILRNGSTIATVSGSTLSYVDKTVAPSTPYQYAVDARDGAGNVSPPSTPVSLTTPAGAPGPVFVQGASSSTTTVTLPSPSTPGDLLVLTAGLYTGGSQQIKAVSDGKNTWTKVGSYDVSGNNSDGEMWYAPNTASVSSVTVTTSASAVALQLQEFSGVAASAPLDASAGSSNTGTSASSGTATPSGSDDLAVGFIAGHHSAQAVTVTSPGYTVNTPSVTTSPNTVTVVSGYQDLGAPTAQSFAGTFGTTMYWAAGVALFKPGAVGPSSDFSISDSPTSQTVTAGSPATSTISTAVTSGSAQSVALSASGAPSGALVSFNPQTVTAGQSSTMTVTTSSTTPTGTSTITVTGTGSSATHTTSFSLTVNPAPVAPAITSTNSATFTQGTLGSFTVTTTGVPTPAISESGALPNGVGFVDNGNGTATLSGTPAAGTAGGYPITISASNGVGATANQSFMLTVGAAVSNDFSISASPTSQTVTAGSPATSTISTAVTSGSAQSVALSASGAPSGALVSFNPQTVTAGQSSTMTVTTSSTTPTGTSTITVTGTGSSATHTTSFSLTVNPVTTSAPALVQSASATESATATSLSGSFPTATKAGDLLVLAASEYTGATNHITSVTDTAGNTWTRVGAYDVSGHNSNGELWYAANAAPSTTVTVHVASAATIAFEVKEFSGVATSAPLDTSAGTSNTGTSASSGTVSAAAGNELAVGFVAGHNNAEAITVNAPGFTNQGQVTSTGTVASIVSGYQVVGAGAQSYGGTFGTAMYWAAGVALFKPAG